MKNLTVLRLAVVMVAAAMCMVNVSCSKDETIPELKIPAGNEDFFTKSMDFDTQAGEKKLTFSSNVSWTASVSGSNWLSITPTSGEAGTNTLIVKAEENTTYDDRNTVISIAAGDSIRRVFVNQKQLDALTLTSDRFEVPAKGGQVQVEVKANIDFEVVIPTEYQSWIHRASSATRGLTTSTLIFNIDNSEEYEKREGKIHILSNGKEEIVNVYQAGSGILTLTKNAFELDNTAQEVAIEISSNFDYKVEMPNADWIKEIKGKTRGISTHTLRLAVSENNDYDGRSAIIKLYDVNSDLSEEVTITQSQKNALLIEKKEYEYDEKGGSFIVEINSNIDYSVSVDCDWIQENIAATRGLEKSTRTFVVSEMTDNSTRIGTITFTNKATGISEKVTVKQNATIFFDNNNLNLIEGSEKTIIVTNNSDQTLTWNSSDESVATVDDNGLVKAVSSGNATITATTADGLHSCRCDVVVKSITDLIEVSVSGGSIVTINGVIQSGSKLNLTFVNNSESMIRLNSLQLIDGVTGYEGNIMTVDADVAVNSSVAYTVTIGLLGIHSPVTCRFRFEHNGKEYQKDAVYGNNSWPF